MAAALVSCGTTGPLDAQDSANATLGMLTAAETAFANESSATFCLEVAANISMCERSWQDWAFSELPAPALETTRFESETLSDGTIRLTISGEYENGRPYVSQVQIIKSDDGDPKAVDPVFWVPRVVADPAPSS